MRVAIALSLAVVCAAAAAEDRTWIERSDRHSRMVLDALGAFHPEWMSELGLERYDTQARDLKARHVEREDAAMSAMASQLRAVRLKERDERVREDLDITLDAIERMRRTHALERRLLVPYRDLPREMYEGLQVLLDKRNNEARRAHALERLRAYAGMTNGTRPLTELARERTEEHAGAGLVWPYRGDVQQQLSNCERYVAGMAELFRASAIQGWEAPHERLGGQ